MRNSHLIGHEGCSKMRHVLRKVVCLLVSFIQILTAYEDVVSGDGSKGISVDGSFSH